MGLPAANYRELTPAEVDEIAGGGGCSHCQRLPSGDGRRYVAIDLGKNADFEEAPDGRIVTVLSQLAGRVYTLRTGYTEERRFAVKCVILCSDCIAGAGRLVDIGPLARERHLLAQEREQTARLTRELEEALGQLESLKALTPGLQALLGKTPKSKAKAPA
jgi:hypothetical protein